MEVGEMSVSCEHLVKDVCWFSLAVVQALSHPSEIWKSVGFRSLSGGGGSFGCFPLPEVPRGHWFMKGRYDIDEAMGCWLLVVGEWS